MIIFFISKLNTNIQEDIGFLRLNIGYSIFHEETFSIIIIKNQNIFNKMINKNMPNLLKYDVDKFDCDKEKKTKLKLIIIII